MSQSSHDFFLPCHNDFKKLTEVYISFLLLSIHYTSQVSLKVEVHKMVMTKGRKGREQDVHMKGVRVQGRQQLNLGVKRPRF